MPSSWPWGYFPPLTPFRSLGVGMASSKGNRNGRLILYDLMAAPGQRITLVAELVEETLFTHSPLGGEVLLFLHEGRPVGQAMTGGDGRAVKPFIPTAVGVVAVSVRLEHTRRITASESSARVFVWDRKRPLLIVSLSALAPRSRLPAVGFPLPDLGATVPPPDGKAVETLSAWARRANLIYVSTADRVELSGLRQWADGHRLPSGPFFLVKAGPLGLAHQLEAWQREGWTNIQGGLVGTPDEARSLVGKGVKTVLPPSVSSKEKWPDKAIRPKDWAEAQKNFL